MPPAPALHIATAPGRGRPDSVNQANDCDANIAPAEYPKSPIAPWSRPSRSERYTAATSSLAAGKSCSYAWRWSTHTISDAHPHAQQDQLDETAGLGSPDKRAAVEVDRYHVVAIDARRHGDSDAAALVLVEIAPQIEAEGASNIAAFMGLKPDGFDSLDEVADAMASYQPHRSRPRTLDGLAKNVRLGEDGKYH